MDIKIYKLLSGEIVMGDEIARSGGDSENRHVSVRRPICLILGGDGAVVMALWLPYQTSEPVKIYLRQIVAEALPAHELANEYCEKCGGIVTAGADALTALAAISAPWAS